MEITFGDSPSSIPTCAVEPVSSVRITWCDGLHTQYALWPQVFEFSGAVFVIMALIAGVFYTNKVMNG
ncbi:MAG TPA: hypothetical protein VJB93_03365 [Patescibacteria group bacterium]|nr:hypothetical protein [Patescibacteria group bacterium]